MLTSNDSLSEYLRVEPKPDKHNQGDAAASLIDPELLFLGNYKRSGDHLLISTENGREVLLRDYFLTPEPKDLFSTEGAVLRGDVVKALAGPLVKAQYAQAASAPSEKPIGRVETITGTATITRANGTVVEVKTGDLVYRGDVVQTGANSSVGISFVDGTAFSMNSQARMVLNEFVFDPNGSSNSAFINLVQGTISFVAGKVAKTGDMKLGTPVATMGIRGTAFQIEISSSLGPTAFYLMLEPGNVSGIGDLYSASTGQLLATISDTGVVTFVTPDGQLRQEPKTNSQLQLEQLVIQQLFNLISLQQQNPIQRTDANPQGTSHAGSPGLIDFLLKLDNVALPPVPQVVQLQVPRLGDPAIPEFEPEPEFETVTVTATPVTAAAVIEDGDGEPDTSGDLTSSYVPQSFDTPYGTFSIGADGQWTYLLDNENPIVNALGPGDTLLDVITVRRTDGSTETIVVTITGVNDPAVITGDSSGSVFEGSNGGISLFSTEFMTGESVTGESVTGDLDADDVDSPDTFVAETIAGSYGTLEINADGEWTYTLDANNPDVQALNDDDQLTDTITVQTADGTPHQIEITINGRNDPPSAADDDYVLDEDTSATGNVLGNDTDLDGPAPAAALVSGPAHGSLQLNPDGSFTYTPEQNFAGTDSFEYETSDGSLGDSATVTLTVDPINDEPVIIAPSVLKYWTPSGLFAPWGAVTPINGLGFADADADNSDVTVVLTVGDGGGAFIAQDATDDGVAVVISGHGGESPSDTVTLTGSIAAINAYIQANNILFDPPRNSLADRTLTVTINDNGATGVGGAQTASTTIILDHVNYGFGIGGSVLFGFGDDALDVHDVNLNGISSIHMGSGENTFVTSWNNLGVGSVVYDGGDTGGNDTGTLVFSPTQFEEILSNASFRSTLQNYLDGNLGSGFSAAKLDLSASSWNAKVEGLEDAHVALATGDSHVVTAVTDDLPNYMGGATGNAASNTLVGSADSNTMSGNGGNDILVGLAGNDTLNGGNGSDILLGGTGADSLNGGNGTDILWGGDDADTFYFRTFDNDTVLDFVHGQDVVKFDPGLFASFSDLLAHATQADHDVVIDDPESSNAITLKNVHKGTLTHNDFIFS